MKVIKMTRFNETSIEEAPLPELKEEEALIKVKYAGICGSDIHILGGHHPSAKPPIILGHEFYGELVDIKSHVIKDFTIGDWVTAHPLSACGHCEYCLDGRENLCPEVEIFGVNRGGCFAEYIKVRADRLVGLDKTVDPEVTALIEPLAVAVHDVKRSGLQVGENVFIIGAGTIGILLAVMAELNGAGEIILTDVDPARITFAQDLGFSVINGMDTNYNEQVRQASGDRGFQRVFETSGTQPGWTNMVKAAAPGATIVLVGIPSREIQADAVSIVLQELDLKGVRIHTFNHFKTVADILKSGRLNKKLKKLVSRVYPAENISQALEDLRNDKSIVKALIRFS